MKKQRWSLSTFSFLASQIIAFFGCDKNASDNYVHGYHILLFPFCVRYNILSKIRKWPLKNTCTQNVIGKCS